MENGFEGRNIIPPNEEERLRALRRYQLLQDLPQGYFSNLASIMALTFDTPIALVSLVTADTVLFPGNIGLPDTPGLPRNVSLCSLAILNDTPTIFTDAVK